MELTKVGEITAPLSTGEVTISIGTNPKDREDGYFYFNTEETPSLIDFQTLLKPKLTELPKLRPLLKDAIKKFGQFDDLAKELPEEKKYFKAFGQVLGKIGIVKNNDASKIKEYSQIIKTATPYGKKLYMPQGLKTPINQIGISPTWEYYKGHFAGTLVNPICLTQHKEAIEESDFFEEIAKLLTPTHITLMEPVDFLREANWVVTETGISLQSDGGVDFTELVLGMLNTSVADFSKMVKAGDGSAASLAGLGINTEKLAGAASNHTACGATGDEKVKNARIALSEAPKKATADPKAVAKRVATLLGKFKALKSSEAEEKLGLIISMMNTIKKLDNVPKQLQTLAKNLKGTKESVKGDFSEDITVALSEGIKVLEEMPAINSTEELDKIFGIILKMYKGWQKLVPKEPHPEKETIEQIDREINLLRDYEKRIQPLRADHETMEHSEEKGQLTTEINALIDEALAALVALVN